ncbi:hypothetical protein FQN54_000992 [Arachnomyces sp. PD_36]|nr:hypothetical protein FQN54_000992 [Arachnomyces sp. PD_36]
MADITNPSATSEDNPPNQSQQELRSRLEELKAQASAKDAVKDYNAAAELYSEATELQAEVNGEMSVANADLLYAYGKSLYNVAVSKSDVLGTKVAGETAPDSKKAAVPENATNNTGLIGEAISRSAAERHSEAKEEKSSHNKPFFQFTGDENFDDSDSGEEEGDGPAEEDDDDDFANAFEVLDLARVLLLRKLEETRESEPKEGQTAEADSQARSIKERLADTYDLQAEISLEGEKFPHAVADLQAALELKKELYSQDNPSLAECHYKLSLALEFSSVTTQNDEDGAAAADNKTATIDEDMRKEAAKHMEAAVSSCKLRIANEETRVETGEVPEEGVPAAKKNIANVREIVADMEQRLIELRRPPVSINDATAGDDRTSSLNSLLGQIMNQPPADQKSRLEEASKGATDLSGLVRKKKTAAPVPMDQPEQPESRSGKKRSASEESGPGKRAKTEDAPSGN